MAFRNLWRFYLGPALTIPLLMLPWVLRDRWMRFALLTCSVLAAGLLAEMAVLEHYAAPSTALVLALVLQAMRHLRVWRWRDRPTGRVVIWGIVVICVILAPLRWERSKPWSLHRARILAQLEADGDRHLVLVRYWPWHNPHNELVYNRADIDSAKVVWAREMGATRNHQLLEYFKDRHVWLVEADAPYPVLSVIQ